MHILISVANSSPTQKSNHAFLEDGSILGAFDKNEVGIIENVECDVLVLGGGLSGCFAAISAARKGCKVAIVEKGAIEKSGSAGTGFDHWESACTNPCSLVTPEEIAYAYVD